MPRERGVPAFEMEKQTLSVAMEEVASVKRIMKEMQEHAKKAAVEEVHQRNRMARNALRHAQAARAAKASSDAAAETERARARKRDQRDRDAWRKQMVDDAKQRAKARAAAETTQHRYEATVAGKARLNNTNHKLPAAAGAPVVQPFPEPWTSAPRDDDDADDDGSADGNYDDDAASWDDRSLPPLRPTQIPTAATHVPSKTCPRCLRRFPSVMHMLMHDAAGCRAQKPRKAEPPRPQDVEGTRRRKAAEKKVEATNAGGSSNNNKKPWGAPQPQPQSKAPRRNSELPGQPQHDEDDAASSKSEPAQAKANIKREPSKGYASFKTRFKNPRSSSSSAQAAGASKEGGASSPPANKAARLAAAQRAMATMLWAKLDEAESIAFADVPWLPPERTDGGRDSFAMLGVPDDANLDARKRAVRRASLRFHPDKFLSKYSRKLVADEAERERIFDALKATAQRINAFRARTNHESSLSQCDLFPNEEPSATNASPR